MHGDLRIMATFMRRGRVIAFMALMVGIVSAPFTLLGLALWTADGNWEFSGSGLRHWLLVKGSTVDRLGLVASAGTPMRYVVRLGEGTDPGATLAIYESLALPDAIVAVYAERCRSLGITVKKLTSAPAAAEAKLLCEADPKAAWTDDVWIVAIRRDDMQATEVRITAGPGLTGIYGF